MVETILSAVGGIVSYFVGSFGSDKLYYPGFDAPFVAWKVLFAFLSAAAVFLSQSNKGLIAVFVVGIVGAVGLGLNYQSVNAIPPVLSATVTSWYCYELAQSCFVGVGVRLVAKLKDVLPKGRNDDEDDRDGG
jgi:hypothetical protein